jgi:hypothetical protein
VAASFIGVEKPEYQEKTTDLPQVTDKIATKIDDHLNGSDRTLLLLSFQHL